jgi:hypothetical protein
MSDYPMPGEDDSARTFTEDDQGGWHEVRQPRAALPAARFTLDYAGLADLVVNYSVATDHDALLAIESALPGTADRPLITGPCELAVDLLADGDGAIDGYRIIIHPDEDPGAPWLASHICRVSYFDELPEPNEESGLYDPAEIIENAVKTANELLEWSRR